MIPDTLSRSVEVRFPTFDSLDSTGTKIEALEGHLTLCAEMQAELASLRLDTHESLRLVRHEWDHLTGWEHLRVGDSVTSIEHAKRELNPELYDAITDATWLIARIGEEFSRLEADYVKVSRLYSMLIGA